MSTGPDEAAVVATLRAAGCVFAEDEARLLVVAGGDLASLVARRVGGEPLEWILGWADFGGVRVAVAPGVFVPRQRTVLLADLAGDALPTGGTVVDLCCGAGAVAARVLAQHPTTTCFAVDVDPVAVACARDNLPGARVLAGDLFAPLPDHLHGQVDVVVANTPYVPTAAIALLPPEAREHEPLHTLDGGPDGLALLGRICAEAPRWLRPGGLLLIEISEGQADLARTAYEAAGLIASVRTDPDGTGVIIGRLPGVTTGR